MKNQDRIKEKQMAYLLHEEFGYTKKSIATLMKISPQQMGTWIKDTGYKVQINNLENELSTARKNLVSLGYEPQKALDVEIIQSITN